MMKHVSLIVEESSDGLKKDIHIMAYGLAQFELFGLGQYLMMIAKNEMKKKIGEGQLLPAEKQAEIQEAICGGKK